jgi:hypothetical protein
MGWPITNYAEIVPHDFSAKCFHLCGSLWKLLYKRKQQNQSPRTFRCMSLNSDITLLQLLIIAAIFYQPGNFFSQILQEVKEVQH